MILWVTNIYFRTSIARFNRRLATIRCPPCGIRSFHRLMRWSHTSIATGCSDLKRRSTSHLLTILCQTAVPIYLSIVQRSKDCLLLELPTLRQSLYWMATWNTSAYVFSQAVSIVFFHYHSKTLPTKWFPVKMCGGIDWTNSKPDYFQPDLYRKGETSPNRFFCGN